MRSEFYLLCRLSAIESMERSLRELCVPFICLLGGPTGKLSCNSKSNSNSSCQGGSSGTGSRYRDSNNLNISSGDERFTDREIEIEIHPTVKALMEFFTSLSTNIIGSSTEMKMETSSSEGSNNVCCGVFALFTDDTYHPLSLFLRNSLVAQLPQMPMFCFDSESIVPPTATRDPRPPSREEPASTNPSAFKQQQRDPVLNDFEELFYRWSKNMKDEDWKFGSRSPVPSTVLISSESSESLDGTQVSRGQSSQCNTASGSRVRFECSNCAAVNFATLRYLLSLDLIKTILNISPQTLDTATKASCSYRTHLTIARLLAGTTSPRRALSDLISRGQDSVSERAARERTGTQDRYFSTADAASNLLSEDDKPMTSSTTHEAVAAAVRRYLIEADLSRYSCFKEMKSGTLSVKRVVAYDHDTIATMSSSSPQLIASAGGVMSVIAPTSLIPSSSVKWVVPWLQLLSPEASSLLRMPNKMVNVKTQSSTSINLAIHDTPVQPCFSISHCSIHAGSQLYLDIILIVSCHMLKYPFHLLLTNTSFSILFRTL